MKQMTSEKQKKFERKMLKSQRHKRIVYNRFFITLLLVLLQFYLWGLFIFRLYGSLSQIILLGIELFGILCVVYILGHNDRPSSKLNWVIIILLFPFVGVLLYMLFGDGKPTTGMAKKLRKAKREHTPVLQSYETAEAKALLQDHGAGTCRYLHDYAGYPAYTDSAVSYYPSGEEMFPDMLQSLEEAKEFILMEYFIIADGKMWQTIRRLLVKKAEEGVQIRLIFDDFGCILTLPPKFEQYMQGLHENIRCLPFNSIMPIFSMRVNNRDHRKLLIVDGKVGFTGGVNIADEYINQKMRFGYWKDSGVRIVGSAVNSLTAMFLNIWNAFYPEKEPIERYLRHATPSQRPSASIVQPYDDCPLDGESVGETVYLDVINRATKYLYIATPYLILDDFMRNALCLAAKRGVDVRILTPGVPDKKTVFRLTRANYAPLLKAGVKIYEYTPGFLHAKHMVADDECAVVGTINLDYRSLYLHFENAVFFTEETAVQAVKTDCEKSFVDSRQVCEPPKRRMIGRAFDSILRVFETLV